MVFEVRKLQEIGNSLYIALPKEWTRKLKLKKGSLVRLSIDPRGVLVILPVDIELKEFSEITLNADKFPNLVRAIVRSYLLGYDIIKVHVAKGITLDHKEAARKACSILLGLGIIDERRDTIVLQVFTTVRVELEELMSKVNMLAQSMYVDLYNALKNPSRELIHSIISRDETLDKLYFYTVRVIRGYMKSYCPEITPMKLLTYRLLLKNLEEIGDTVKNAAKTLLRYMKSRDEALDNIKEESRYFSSFVSKLTHIHSVAFKAVLNEDYIRAENYMVECELLRNQMITTLSKCSKPTRTIMRRYYRILNIISDILDLV